MAHLKTDAQDILAKATAKMVRSTKKRTVRLTKKGLAMRQHIVKCAADLFHAHGTDGTSIDMILKTSQTGKSQFYHYFKSKDELILEVINARSEEIKEACVDQFCSWDDLDAWADRQIKMIEGFGNTRCCALGKMATDLHDAQEEAAAKLNDCFESLEGQIEMFLLKQARSGNLAPHADIAALSSFFVAAQQGASLLAKTSRNSSVARKVMTETLRHLKSFRIEQKHH